MWAFRFAAKKLLISLLALSANVVAAQDYPNKPIRIFTGAAGGGSDFPSRVIAQEITGPLGQPVIVENRGTMIAAQAVSKAPPDGYSLLVTGASLWITPLLQKVPYDDAEKDFSPISPLVREVNVLAVHPSLPVKSVKDLIVLAKTKPGALNYASGQSGSPNHLGAELLKSMAGIDLVRVTYKGVAQGITGLVAGEVQLAIADVGLVAPHMKSGKLRVLAVTTPEPSALAPGLPTMAASGLSGYEMSAMTGIFAPAKTPAPIINRLNQEILRALNLTEVKEKVLSSGAEPVGKSPGEFAATIKSDIARWGKLIKALGIRTE